VAEFTFLRRGGLRAQSRWAFWGCQFNAGPQPAKHGAKIIRLFLPMRRKHGYNWRLGDSAHKPAGAGKPMVVTSQSPEGPAVRILARGNFSLGAGGLLNLLLALTTVTLGLAGLLAWQGFWPVLLIAVIQLVLVIWILIKAWESAWVSELVIVSPNRIEVIRQRHKRKRRYQLEAAWAVVEQEQPRVAWYGPRYILRSRGTKIELGQFLTIDEKALFADQVRKAVKKHSAI
jgi:uncharacterized membrane protein